MWYLLSGLSGARTAGRALSEYGLGLHPPRFLVLSHVLAIPWSHLLCNSTLLMSDHLRHMFLRSDSGSERRARSLIETWAWLLQVRRAEPVDGHRASHGPANQSKRKQEKRRFQLLQLLVLESARSFLPSYVRLARCAAWWSAGGLHWASCPPGHAVTRCRLPTVSFGVPTFPRAARSMAVCCWGPARAAALRLRRDMSSLLLCVLRGSSGAFCMENAGSSDSSDSSAGWHSWDGRWWFCS